MPRMWGSYRHAATVAADPSRAEAMGPGFWRSEFWTWQRVPRQRAVQGYGLEGRVDRSSELYTSQDRQGKISEEGHRAGAAILCGSTRAKPHRDRRSRVRYGARGTMDMSRMSDRHNHTL